MKARMYIFNCRHPAAGAKYPLPIDDQIAQDKSNKRLLKHIRQR